MKGQLQDKVAIITGGGTGIGEAICRKFARAGAKIVVNGLPGDPISDVGNAIVQEGGQAISVTGDVSQEEPARECINAAIQQYGKLDVLINNAGVLLANPETDDMPVDIFDEHIRCNVRSAFLMTKFALPHLRQTKGNVISAGSEAGVNGQPRNTPYGGTKAFLHAFMMGVAVEQAQYGVRANCVSPGAIDTAWTHKETGAVDADRECIGYCDVVRQTWNGRGSRQRLCVPRVGRRQLRQRRGMARRRRIGVLAGREASTPPPGKIDLHHSHDGMKHKDVVKIK